MGSPFSKTQPITNPSQAGSPFGESPVIVTGFNPPPLPVVRFYATFATEAAGTVTANVGGAATVIVGTPTCTDGVLSAPDMAAFVWPLAGSRGFETTISVGTISGESVIYFGAIFDTSISGYRILFSADTASNIGSVGRMDANVATDLITFSVTSQSQVYLNVPANPATDMTIISGGVTTTASDATYTGTLLGMTISDSTFNAPLTILDL